MLRWVLDKTSDPRNVRDKTSNFLDKTSDFFGQNVRFFWTKRPMDLDKTSDGFGQNVRWFWMKRLMGLDPFLGWGQRHHPTMSKECIMNQLSPPIINM